MHVFDKEIKTLGVRLRRFMSVVMFQRKERKLCKAHRRRSRKNSDFLSYSFLPILHYPFALIITVSWGFEVTVITCSFRQTLVGLDQVDKHRLPLELNTAPMQTSIVQPAFTVI